MSLKSAFTTAWSGLKKAATATASFLQKADAAITADLPKVQAGVQQAEKIVEAAAPQLTPAITAFDGIEEALVGEVAAAVHDGSAITQSSGETTVTLSAELSAVVKQIVGTLSGHPAVVAAVKPTV